MEITICGSVDFTPDIIKVKRELEAKGCIVHTPYFTDMIIDGKMTFDEYMAAKTSGNGDILLREAQDVDFFRRYWDFIIASDAILVLNMTKNGINGYIGGNTLMEMGFAYGQRKKIFLYNPIPARGERMHYVDEIIDLKPIILHGDLNFLLDQLNA